MYELIEDSDPNERKKLSFSTLLTTGRQKEIRSKILVCLNTSPMTARQLAETIPCMRSSVCKKTTAFNQKRVVRKYKKL